MTVNVFIYWLVMIAIGSILLELFTEKESSWNVAYSFSDGNGIRLGNIQMEINKDRLPWPTARDFIEQKYTEKQRVIILGMQRIDQKRTFRPFWRQLND